MFNYFQQTTIENSIFISGKNTLKNGNLILAFVY